MNPEDEFLPFKQCILECEYGRGESDRKALHAASLQAEEPTVLWEAKKRPSYKMMHTVGSVTDQYGPVVKLKYNFNGLTERNLAVLEANLNEELNQQQQAEGVGAAAAAQDLQLDEISSMSSSKAPSKRSSRYAAHPELKRKEETQRFVRRYRRALATCRECFAPCSGVY